MEKPSLFFFTNIPTPYQKNFFDELALIFNLTVIYYSNKENNRNWNLESIPVNYKEVYLKNNWIAKIIQLKVLEFHYSFELKSFLADKKCDYAIVSGSYWIPNSRIALSWCKKNVKKTAYFSEPLFKVNSKIKFFIKSQFLKRVNVTCDYVFCIGEYAKQTFEDYGVIVTKHNIPYNINSNFINSIDKNELNRYIEKYKPNDKKIFLTSGQLIHRKGIDVVINAFKQIQDTNVKLIILGDGPQKEQLEDIALNDLRIEFVGFQNPQNIPYFFSIADAFVFASRYDGWAIVILEAIAANLPIISSDKVGSVVDLISNEVDGLICQSENISEFADAMKKLINNPKKVAELKHNSKALIPKISSKNIAKKVYDIFVN